MATADPIPYSSSSATKTTNTTTQKGALHHNNNNSKIVAKTATKVLVEDTGQTNNSIINNGTIVTNTRDSIGDCNSIGVNGGSEKVGKIGISKSENFQHLMKFFDDFFDELASKATKIFPIGF